MIKFRAWDKENEIYLYNVQDAYDTLSGFVKYGDGEDADYDEDCFGAFLNNKQYDIEQFTGLTDVNGKDIYEGDIVENERGEILRVSYSAIDASFVAGNCYFGSIGAGKEIRIIGNVHANPELLKG
ncbi:YopX family protein [Lactiplantibacillus plantarum]|uniref:YopX family protein n=1 Tax=Lactiplantibacillus plantarum TaxID=1590 RepID=UPI00240D60CD|nr:YopX family protein [Lactiplantibacillus plantarum]MDG2544905.1 YopX family protein [Lactiplantibacillus plantarum]